MFNPRPRIEAAPIAGRHACWVVDDALLDPHAWRRFAVEHAGRFEDSPHNAYPGPEMRLPDALSQPLSTFFSMHLRDRLGARRVQRMYARLSLATRAPHELQPRQSIPHVDRLEAGTGQMIGASVLYLFDDADLGGTSFYAPKKPLPEMATLLRDSAELSADGFATRHGIAPGYMTGSNDWFERLSTVPAKFNRLIVYDGSIFHSGDIRRPDLLDADPLRGRLTLNGFFVCSRRLAA